MYNNVVFRSYFDTPNYSLIWRSLKAFVRSCIMDIGYWLQKNTMVSFALSNIWFITFIFKLNLKFSMFLCCSCNFVSVRTFKINRSRCKGWRIAVEKYKACNVLFCFLSTTYSTTQKAVYRITVTKRTMERGVLGIKLINKSFQCSNSKSNEGQKHWKSYNRTKIELVRAPVLTRWWRVEQGANRKASGTKYRNVDRPAPR